MKYLRGLLPYWGIIFMLCLTIHHALQFGRRWEFGRYGMPHTLVSADGSAHPDGSPIDPFTLRMIEAGIEEEVMLVIVVVLLVILTCLAVTVRKGIALRKQIAMTQAAIGRLLAEKRAMNAARRSPGS